MNRCRRGRFAFVVLIACSGLACPSPEEEERAPAPSFELAAEGAFRGHAGPRAAKPFNAVAGDMDLDGDPDLLINYHVLGPAELYENIDGQLHLLNTEDADVSGLEENRGVPALYATQRQILAGIGARDEPAVYVWHDEDRMAFWRVHVSGDPELWSGFTLALEFSRPVDEVEGLETGAFRRDGAFRLSVDPAGLPRSHTIGVKAREIANRMTLELRGRGERPPIFVGRDKTRSDASRVSLIKPDPHGVAWVQVIGSPEPELYLTRGANRGMLVPPLEPKTDRFYVYVGRPEQRYGRTAPRVIPEDYGRGRQVEWVDVDNDGVHELYVGCKETSNRLLVWNADRGVYEDHAGQLDLGLQEGESFAWFDIDGDGFQDLVYVEQGRARVARNNAGVKFEEGPGEDYGLMLPEAPAVSKDLFSDLAFHVLDYDNDGELDLWVSGHGFERKHFLFRGKNGEFADVTREVRLDELPGARLLLPADLDNDGYEDAVALGDEVVALWNRGGRRFQAVPFEAVADLGEVPAGAIGDVDSDGRVDLMLITAYRHLVRNVTPTQNGVLVVTPEVETGEPIGALVAARYDDGRIKVQRYGSAHNAGGSQTTLPLRFGIPAGRRIERVDVLWPGDERAVTISVFQDQRELRLTR
jgi:hypothetical protein